ncbi:hypothetical protein [Luteolibacter sp. AS25]|uniref:hypothetical protein n=1 Tax=Luteolibacter sp. AS25 TaxID=3135776 RepID=UPI00398B2233
MKPLLLLASALLFACQPTTSTYAHSPFSKEFVPDRTPVSTSATLQSLLKTLPVWDVPEEGIDEWVAGGRTPNENTLFVAGDGAQVDLRLTKLRTPDRYELKLGTEDWPEGGVDYYILQRMENGWKPLSHVSPKLSYE